MSSVSGCEVFKTDYKDKDAVIRLAKKMGKGMSVVKHADRPNYNITHTSRRDLWDIPGVEVVCHV